MTAEEIIQAAAQEMRIHYTAFEGMDSILLLQCFFIGLN